MDLDFFKIDGQTVEMQPAITKWGCEALGDDPAKHRWRAWWVSDEGKTHGIELRAYPVIKVNPASVWIDQWGNREATKQPWEEGAPGMAWVDYPGRPIRKRLCHNGAGAAWAKPTQEEAIRSLAIRLCRWTGRLHDDVKRAESAITVLTKLRPEWTGYARDAWQHLNVLRVER